MALSCPSPITEPIEGWLFINSKPGFCQINNGEIKVGNNEQFDQIEYSIPISNIITTINDTGNEIDVLSKNSPPIHILTDRPELIHKLKTAISNDKTQGNEHIFEHDKFQLSDFQIIKIIGQGYCGQVQLARGIDNQLYALKSISKEKVATSNALQKLIQERNILIDIDNPFITKLYGAFQTPNRLFLILEFVGGGDLQHHLDSGIMFSRTQITFYLAQIVLALEYLHKKGIAYRDLKPSNLLIGKDGYLKLADFGFAKYVVDYCQIHSLCGTHEYLAPEMISGSAYDYSVDWWALGVIAYQLLCGILPFRNENLYRLYDLIVACKYRLPYRLDSVTRNFISGLLQKDPESRFTIDQIKNHAFFKEINWKQLEKKKYKMDFIPWNADNDSCYNFDTALFKENETTEIDEDVQFSYSERNEIEIPDQDDHNEENYHVPDFSFDALKRRSCSPTDCCTTETL